MSTRTAKTKVTGRLSRVIKEQGRYRFSIRKCDVGPKLQTFLLSSEKALAIANDAEAFPLGVTIKVSARIKEQRGVSDSIRQLIHANILSVDGVETRAWSERVGSTQVDPAVLAASGARVEAARAAEEAAMSDRSPPEQDAITDPSIAFNNAMRIVRRQRKLKDPKLSQQEIWQLRDALNLLAEKLGIV